MSSRYSHLDSHLHHTSPLSLADVPWYHGSISWHVAKERLTKQDSDCFLVRKSQSQPGKYCLSVMYGGVIKHFVIRKKDQWYKVEGTEKQFSSLQELVAHYKKHYLSTDWEMLTTPCPSPLLIEGLILEFC